MVTGRASLEEACHANSGPIQSGTDTTVPAISAITARPKQSSHLTARLQTIVYPSCTCRLSASWQKTNARRLRRFVFVATAYIFAGAHVAAQQHLEHSVR